MPSEPQHHAHLFAIRLIPSLSKATLYAYCFDSFVWTHMKIACEPLQLNMGGQTPTFMARVLVHFRNLAATCNEKKGSAPLSGLKDDRRTTKTWFGLSGSRRRPNAPPIWVGLALTDWLIFGHVVQWGTRRALCVSGLRTQDFVFFVSRVYDGLIRPKTHASPCRSCALPYRVETARWHQQMMVEQILKARFRQVDKQSLNAVCYFGRRGKSLPSVWENKNKWSRDSIQGNQWAGGLTQDIMMLSSRPGLVFPIRSMMHDSRTTN